jgi:hypothetical protein
MTTPAFYTLTEAAEICGVTPRRLRALAAEGRIAGAERRAGTWFLPRDFRISSADRGPALTIATRRRLARGRP